MFKIYNRIIKKKNKEDNIIFMHIHKCGGSSLDKMVKEFLPISFARQQTIQIHAAESHRAAQLISEDSSFANTMIFREMLVVYYVLQKKKYIRGHFYFSEKWYELAKDKYKLITILRHPVKRFFSNYFFNRYKVINHNHARIELSLEEYIESADAKKSGSTYISYFGGDMDKYSLDENIEIVRKNIDKFHVVGCIENLSDFVKKLKEVLMISGSLNMPHINVSPKSESFRNQYITKEIEARVYEICKPDIEIYNYVRGKDKQ